MRLIPKLTTMGLVLVSLLWTAGPTAAKETLERPPRMKIGLALGGGSAMGFTHIGVLRWLEENRIPVDYIAGTSMGGLMGGCYAMGMSPDQMQKLVTGVDWEQIFNSNPPYNYLEYRRKEDQQEYPNEIKIGTRDWLMVPNGLAVYQVYLLLSRIAMPYSTVASFDELPIPYRCVATDIRNSQAVVLHNGSLAEALRATMSIPGFFVPVEREGRVLVDGGLVDNVPADVVQAMGADFVIAVNCNESNERKDLRRLDSFLLSTINTVVVKNTREALRAANVTIHPQLEGVSYLDWQKAAVFIQAGYEAAAKNAEYLRPLALTESAWREYLLLREGRKPVQPLLPTAIVVRGTNQVNRDFILNRLHSFAGHPVDPQQLEMVLTEIMGSGFYESIRYEFQLEATQPVLVVTVTEKPYGPPFIGFALQGNTGGDRTEVNLRSRTTAFNILGEASELRLDVTLGTTASLMAELYQPLLKSDWFGAAKLSLEKEKGSYFQNETRVSDFKVHRVAAEIDLGYTFNRYCEMRLGYLFGNQDLVNVVGQPLDSREGPVQKVGLKWAYSKADGDPHLQKGVTLKMAADWYLEAPEADDPFAIAETSLKWIFPAHRRDLIFTRLAVGGTLKGDAPFLQQFTLGGSLHLGTYYFDELRGPNYWLGTLGYLKCIGKPFWGGNPIYAGIFLENGGAFDSWSAVQSDLDLSVGLIATTAFGVVYLGTSFGERTNGRIDLTLGQQF
jgi:NTE family protein